MDPTATRALLEWYAAMGVTEAISDTPQDWAAMTAFAAPVPAAAQVAVPASRPDRPIAQREPPPPNLPPEPPPYDEFDAPPAWGDQSPPRMPQPPATSLRRAPVVPPDEAILSARELAPTAQSLDELRAMLERFDGCGLKATAKSLCFYRGVAQARLMVIGEAPGADEDRAGLPFVGPAGRLLDKMLAAIGLAEQDVHITNVVYWRPPGNRTPTPHETEVLKPFLARQMALVAPHVMLLLGGAAAKQVLDTPEGIMKLRGKWREVAAGERKVRAMATLHPAYLLRTPAAKRNAWRDLMAVKDALDGKG
jgi:DNA polymerase